MSPRKLASWCVAAALSLGFSGCDSNADQQVELAKLSDKCRINSDCGSPLVCVFERCHTQCETSRDCGDGARCVQSAQRRNVCQLPDEESCDPKGDCPGEQVCGVDAECRDACGNDDECLSEQVCSGGTCADARELDDAGQLEPSPDRPTTTLLPCAFDSDCPGAQICSGGACKDECSSDGDCAVGTACVDAVCNRVARPGECRLSSDCPEDQECADAQCRPVSPEPELECRFDSDCLRDGEHCDGGKCDCECAISSDCGSGQVCVDDCACKPSRVIVGDVYISNERELEALRDVVEVTGKLEVQIRGSGEYHLPSLKKVGLFGAYEVTGSIWLESLEEAPGGVTCYQDCRLPRLRSSGIMSFNSSSVSSIELPELESADTVSFWYCRDLRRIEAPKLKSVYDLRLQVLAKLKEISLPELETAHSLTIGGNESLESLSLPKVKVQYDVDVGNNPRLEALVLPGVQNLDGRLNLGQLLKLKRASFPALEQVYDMNMQLMPELVELEVPQLSRVVSSLYFATSRGPEALSFPSLTLAGAVQITAITGTRSLSAPVLTETSSFMYTQSGIEVIDLPLEKVNGAVSIEANPDMTTLRLSALTETQQLTVAVVPKLTSLDLSSLATANGLWIIQTGLDNLRTLYADGESALTNPGSVEIGYNPALPVCATNQLSVKLAAAGFQGTFLSHDNLQCDCQGAVCQ